MGSCNDRTIYLSENKNPYKDCRYYFKTKLITVITTTVSCWLVSYTENLSWQEQLLTYQFCNNDLVYPTDFPPLVLEG